MRRDPRPSTVPGGTLTGPHSGEFEWPTWLLAVGVYGGWFVLLDNFYVLTPWIAAPLLVYLLTLHSSLCHEVLHGHPTRIRWLNDLLGQIPLGLLVPYFTFRESHLHHHQDDILTLPGKDPESFYLGRDDWARMNTRERRWARFKMTLVGRFLVDPGEKLIAMLGNIKDDLKHGRWSRVRRYTVHFLLAGFVLFLAVGVFGIPAWSYLLIAYAANSLLQLRSFYEHRPTPEEGRRSVIVEAGPLFRLLFLNNNLHAVHHRYPRMPWYRIPEEYRRHREDYLEENGHFLFRGYRDWRKFLFRPVDEPVHPFA